MEEKSRKQYTIIPKSFKINKKSSAASCPGTNKKKLRSVMLRSLSKMADTYSPANAVPSARAGLTSLFGMGRGGTPLPNRLNYGF